MVSQDRGHTVVSLLVATEHRPPQIRTQIFAAAKIAMYLPLPLTKDRLSNMATISWQME